MELIIQHKKRKFTKGDFDDIFIVGLPSALSANCESSFKPLYLVSQWNEPLTTRECVFVAILLPSRIIIDRAGKNMDELEVVESGRIFQLNVT